MVSRCNMESLRMHAHRGFQGGDPEAENDKARQKIQLERRSEYDWSCCLAVCSLSAPSRRRSIRAVAQRSAVQRTRRRPGWLLAAPTAAARIHGRSAPHRLRRSRLEQRHSLRSDAILHACRIRSGWQQGDGGMQTGGPVTVNQRRPPAARATRRLRMRNAEPQRRKRSGSGSGSDNGGAASSGSRRHAQSTVRC